MTPLVPSRNTLRILAGRKGYHRAEMASGLPRWCRGLATFTNWDVQEMDKVNGDHPCGLSDRSSANPSDGSFKAIKVLGIPVACCTYDSALDLIKTLARNPRPAAVCPANTHIVGEGRHNPVFGKKLARFELILPDGMPI